MDKEKETPENVDILPENGEVSVEKPKNKETKMEAKRGRFLKVRDVNYLRSMSRKEVFSYIRKLHKLIKKQNKKISKYKVKLKNYARKAKEGSPKKALEDIKEEEPKSFIEEIKEAAEQAQNENGFIYEPTSGLYYDQKTGYYYNAEYGLYYDGSTGCYYNYDQQKNEFTFHSQVQVQPEYQEKIKSECGDRKSSRRDDKIRKIESEITEKPRKRRKSRSSNESDDDKEDGELSSDDNSEIVDECNESYGGNDDEDIVDIAEKYPPSLRMIVQETNLPKLKVGELHLITFKGGTLGREGDHDVLIPDLNVSKYHLKFTYDADKGLYQCVDLGSRNGTILNGKRMATAMQESELFDIEHGSIIQVAQTKLLCHIHKGNATCGHCEPGLVMEPKEIEKVTTISHKAQLKKLQKRYGLENEKYVEKKSDPNYNDRAQVRRKKVGSSNDHEKTEVASTETEISKENKGFKMLCKLGWNKGETLGKNNEGLLEPINVANNPAQVGLGCTERPLIAPISINKNLAKKTEAWQKAQERYKNIKEDIFAADSSDEDNNSNAVK